MEIVYSGPTSTHLCVSESSLPGHRKLANAVASKVQSPRDTTTDSQTCGVLTESPPDLIRANSPPWSWSLYPERASLRGFVSFSIRSTTCVTFFSNLLLQLENVKTVALAFCPALPSRSGALTRSCISIVHSFCNSASTRITTFFDRADSSPG